MNVHGPAFAYYSPDLPALLAAGDGRVYYGAQIFAWDSVWMKEKHRLT